MLRNSTLRDGDGLPIDVVVTDLSTTGFSVEAPLDLQVGGIVRLGLGGAGTASARIIRRADSTYGCQFLQPLGADRVEAAFKYNEILASIGSAVDVPVDIGALDEPYRWSRRARVGVMLGSAAAAWAAVLIVWFAI